MEKSQIAEFFKDRSVFITGSTGLMGKVLVWKLLKSCPEIKAIYVLIRPKRGKSELLRYYEIIKAPVRMFEIFREQRYNNSTVLDGFLTLFFTAVR